MAGNSGNILVNSVLPTADLIGHFAEQPFSNKFWPEALDGLFLALLYIFFYCNFGLKQPKLQNERFFLDDPIIQL